MRDGNASLADCQNLVSARIPVRVSVNYHADVIHDGLSRTDFLELGDECINRVRRWIVGNLQF